MSRYFIKPCLNIKEMQMRENVKLQVTCIPRKTKKNRGKVPSQEGKIQ